MIPFVNVTRKICFKIHSLESLKKNKKKFMIIDVHITFKGKTGKQKMNVDFYSFYDFLYARSYRLRPFQVVLIVSMQFLYLNSEIKLKRDNDKTKKR